MISKRTCWKHHVVNDLEGFGEPIFDLIVSKAQVRLGLMSPFTVRFAIYPDRNLVVVRRIHLVPDHSLTNIIAHFLIATSCPIVKSRTTYIAPA